MSTRVQWKGVMPAMTTGFHDDLSIDHAFVARHAQWLVDNGGTGIVPSGSLGEGATLSTLEKQALWKTVVDAVGDAVPVIPGIAALSTQQAADLARAAADAGCRGLMVLPPYAYSTDWREMKAHVAAVMEATDLACMLYNNPVAYKTDFLPEHIVELAQDHENLVAVKESSTDTRRITAIRALIDDARLTVGVGVDDSVVEGVRAGAQFWIAGLVNAFPKESVELFDLAGRSDAESAQRCEALYRWFLPLLRLDTVPKFVQLIKLVQSHVGMGNARVRAPRLELDGADLQNANEIITRALETKPNS